MNARFYFILIAGALFQAELQAQDNTKTFTAVKDNTIYSESDNSNGVGDFIFAGTTARGALRRSLISFQVTIPGVPEFPLLINKVTVSLKPNKTASSTPQTFSFHRLLKDWGESASNANSQEGLGAAAQTDDATWNYGKFKAISWTTAGADFESVPSATFTISDLADQSISSNGLLEDVKFWLSNSTQNFGWILLGNESVSTATAYRFESRENGSQMGPRLQVDYTFATHLEQDKTLETNKLVYLPELSIVQYPENEGITEMQVFDVSGKQIMNSSSGKITTNHFLPGFYIVQANKNGTIIQNKFYIYQ